MAIDAENAQAIEWFQNFILEENTACANRDDSDSNKKSCLQIFCTIGDAIEEDYAINWLGDFDEFEGFIDNMIQDEVNARENNGDNNLWCASENAGIGCDDNIVEDVSDLGYWWVSASDSDGPGLCGDFVSFSFELKFF